MAPFFSGHGVYDNNSDDNDDTDYDTAVMD